MGRVNKLQKQCVTILSFFDFNDQTNGLCFEFKLLKIADVFKLQKIVFMLEFINNDIHDKLESLFILKVFIHALLKSSVCQRQEHQNVELTR